MQRALRHLSRHLRPLALVMLLFTVVSNPLLAVMGDVHELSLASATHTAPTHCDVTDVRETEGQADAGDILHALVHGAHACGHLVGLTTPTFVVDPSFGLAAVPDHAVKPLNSLQPLTIIRPPITA